MSSRHHIDALTGIRGIAAIWVLLHHLAGQFPMNQVNTNWLDILASKGWLGVDLFFILSGFVISYVHRDDFSKGISYRGIHRFLVLRFARVYPVHFITLISLLFIYIAAYYFFNYRSNAEAFTVEKFFYALTLTNGLGIDNSLGWNIPSWSVSAEVFAYLCFPLLTWLLFAQVLTVRKSIFLISAILVFSSSIGYVHSGGKQYMPPWELTLVRLLSEFLIGCILYSLYQHVKEESRNRFAVPALISIAILVALDLPSIFDVLFIISFMCLLFGLTSCSNTISRTLSRKPLIYLGEISYSIYLSHSIVFIVLGQLLKQTSFLMSDHFVYASAGLYVVSVVAVSHILYYVVEKPMRDKIKKRFLAENKGSVLKRTKLQIAAKNK